MQKNDSTCRDIPLGEQDNPATPAWFSWKDKLETVGLFLPSQDVTRFSQSAYHLEYPWLSFHCTTKSSVLATVSPIVLVLSHLLT